MSCEESNEDLHVLYTRLCREHREEPQENLLRKFKCGSIGSDGVLDLSSLTLSTSACSILSKMFRHDLMVVKLILADCMVNEKSLKSLLGGLKGNSCLKELDLRGNNLKQCACDALGDFIKVSVLHFNNK